jgi:hypothetical protein
MAGPRLDVFSRQLEHAHPDANKDQLLTVNPLPRLGTSTSPQSARGRIAHRTRGRHRG